MNAVTAKRAKKNIDSLITKVISDAEPTIICNNSGEQAVLLSLDEFNSWQETLYLLASPANAEHLRASIAQARAGRTQEHDLIDP